MSWASVARSSDAGRLNRPSNAAPCASGADSINLLEGSMELGGNVLEFTASRAGFTDTDDALGGQSVVPCLLTFGLASVSARICAIGSCGIPPQIIGAVV